MQRIINNHYNKIYKFRLWQEKAFARLPSSVVEFALHKNKLELDLGNDRLK